MRGPVKETSTGSLSWSDRAAHHKCGFEVEGHVGKLGINTLYHKAGKQR
jgi:hypothetical protein